MSWIPTTLSFSGVGIFKVVLPFLAQTNISTDICGKLEGQTIVEDSIRVSPPYSYRMEHMQDQREAQSWREILEGLRQRDSAPINGLVNA
jgi:hypothetical protein